MGACVAGKSERCSGSALAPNLLTGHSASPKQPPPAPVFTLPGQINPFLEKPTTALLLLTRRAAAT